MDILGLNGGLFSLKFLLTRGYLAWNSLKSLPKSLAKGIYFWRKPLKMNILGLNYVFFPKISRASYEVSIVRILEKIDRVRTAPHCML